MKTKELIKCLYRTPLSYMIIRQRGSHRLLKSKDYPDLHLAYHDSFEISGFKIRKILVEEIGLSEQMAWQVTR